MNEQEEAAGRLQEFIRSHTSGGCRIFSKGDGCLCPLCDVARLMYRPVASDRSDDVQPHTKWEIKNWGRVWHRFYDEYVGESLLEVQAGQRCSMHYHEQRANAFICISAELDVEVYGNSVLQNDVDPYKIPDRNLYAHGPVVAHLTAGTSFVVWPLDWHLFKVKKPGRVVEIYYCPDGTAPRQDDIVRFDIGCECEVDRDVRRVIDEEMG